MKAIFGSSGEIFETEENRNPKDNWSHEENRKVKLSHGQYEPNSQFVARYYSKIDVHFSKN